MDPLAIHNNATFDDRISKVDEYIFKPYNSTSIHESDEIRVAIQTENIITLPCQSYLFFEGTFTNSGSPDAESAAKIVNNGLAFLFDEIRMEINGVTIDRTRNVGISSLLKGYASMNLLDCRRYENAGWRHTDNVTIVSKKRFNAAIPLKLLLGFAEDFTQILVNVRQELIMIRSKNTKNVTVGTAGDPGVIKLSSVEWRMPVLTVSDTEKLKLLKVIENDTPLKIPFRAWELYEHPSIPQATSNSWNITSSLKTEKPRFMIIGFQTNRNGIDKDASKFDHCNITDLKVYLNGERFPYNNYNLDFHNDKYTMLYEHYANFQNAYYGSENFPLLTRDTFKSIAPLFIIDCSKQKEEIKYGAVNISLEFSSSENIAAETTAYCLIIHDRLLEYTPLTNIVRTIV